MPKLTFALDDEPVTALRQMAQRRRKPQSLIVREAIARYAEGEDVLSDRDRERLLRVVRRIRTGPATRSQRG